MKHIQYIREGIARIACMLLMALGFVMLANSALAQTAQAPSELILEFHKNADKKSLITTAEEGQKVYIHVKTDGKYWINGQTFYLKAPASFESRDSVRIDFPASKSELETPIEYTMPFNVGEQDQRVDSYVIDDMGKGLKTLPVAIKLLDAKNLVQVSFKPLKDSYREGETIQFEPKLTYADGSAFVFSKQNKDVQTRAYFNIPYTYRSALDPSKTISSSITVNYDAPLAPVEIETVPTLGTQGEIIYTINSEMDKTDSSSILGLSNGETAKVSLFDNTQNPIKAELSIDKSTYHALDVVSVTVNLGANNNGATAVRLKLNVSEKDVFADSLTGNRLDSEFEVLIPVNANQGSKKLRITPETALNKSNVNYSITLLGDNDVSVDPADNVKTFSVTGITQNQYDKINYKLSMTTDSTSKDREVQMSQGETGYIYITSTFNDYRLGAVQPFSFHWQVEGSEPFPIIGADNNECQIVRGEAQTRIALTPQPSLEEKSFIYTPDASNDGKIEVDKSSIKVKVIGRTDRLIALQGADTIQYGGKISLKGFLADTEMNPISTEKEIPFRLHIRPDYITYIKGGASLFDSNGASFNTYYIRIQESFSEAITFDVIDAKSEYYLPIKFGVTPVSSIVTSRQEKIIDLYDYATLTIETLKIAGEDAYADHELPESKQVEFEVKLSKKVKEDMKVIIKFSSDLFLGDGTSVEIKAGSNTVTFTETVDDVSGFQGKRPLYITFDKKSLNHVGLNKVDPSVFYVIDNNIQIVPDITQTLMEGDNIQLNLKLSALNSSADSLPIIVKLVSDPTDIDDNKEQLYRENLQDSYVFYILTGKDSVTGTIPTVKRLLNDERTINWSINFLKETPLGGSILILNDDLYKMNINFEPIQSSIAGVQEGQKVLLRATLTPSNNSNEEIQVKIAGRNQLIDLGYPDFLDSTTIITFAKDSKYVDFELTTFNLNQLFVERFGSVIVKDYIYPVGEKDYFNSVDSVKTKITAVYAKPTFRFYSVDVDGNVMASSNPDLQAPPISAAINIEEPDRLKTKQVTLRAEQVSGTLSKSPITVLLKNDGQTAIENVNYVFTSPKAFMFDCFEKNASGIPDTPKAKGELMPVITLNILNDASNDVEHKIMQFALDANTNNLEDGASLVTLTITPRNDFSPTIEGVGFSPRQPVYIPLSGAGFFSIFASVKPKISSIDITASGLKYGIDFDLFIVNAQGSETPLLNIIGKPNTFKIEIPANTAWLTLKVKPKQGAVSLNKEKKLTLRMSNALYTTINTKYASDAITIYSDNPNANPDTLVIPIEEENSNNQYYMNCLQNDRSYKMNETDILVGATVKEVTKPNYGDAEIFVQESYNVRYTDKNPKKQLFDQFRYTLSEYGQGAASATINVYKGNFITTTQMGTIPLSPAYFNTEKPKFQGYYFDSIVDPQNKREKKITVAFKQAHSDSIVFTLKGKIKLYSSKAVAGSLKSGQFLFSIIDDPAVQLPYAGLRITSKNTNTPDSVIGVAIVTPPKLTSLKEIEQLKKNKFAIKIKGQYLSQKPTFYFEYFASNNKMKRQKLKILKVLDREALSPVNVVDLQEKGTFYVEAPYFITSIADTRIDFIAFNQCGYAVIKNTNIYDIAKAQNASYAAPMIKDELDFQCVMNNKNEMIVGIVSTSNGDDKSISFSLNYVDIYNKEKTIKLPLQSSYIDKHGVKHDLKPARQNSIFYVKIPHLLLSPEMPLINLSCRNSIGQSTRTNINWLNFINTKYPTLHTPSLKDKIPVSDMFKTDRGNLVIKCTGEYLTKPTFYGRYFDKKGKLKLIKFKIVTTFYDENGKYYTVENEQKPINGVSIFYIEIKDITPFREAGYVSDKKGHGDIIVTTTSSALSLDFYTNAELKLEPNN